MPRRTKVQSVGDNARQRRHPQNEEFWRRHIAAWRASGGSKRAYCTQHDLGYWSFVDWARKIERRDREKVRPAGVAAPVNEGHCQGGNPFVPIRVVQPGTASADETAPDRGEAGASGQEIEIVLPSGAVIRLHDKCNAVFVANLLSALKA